MNYKSNKSKLVTIVVVCLILVIFYFIISELLKATVNISTDGGAQITIKELSGGKEVWSASGETTYSVRLKKGSYVVQLNKDETSSKKTVDLGFLEKSEVKLQSIPLLGLVRTSEQSVKSVGVYKNEVVGLHARTPVLVNEAGKTVYSQFYGEINDVIFSSSNVFAEHRKNGDVAIVTDGKARVIYVAKNSNNQDIPVIDIAYNSVVNNFCALLSDGRVLSIGVDGTITEALTAQPLYSYVRCHGDLITTGEYVKYGDAEEVVRKGNVNIYKAGELEKKLETPLLSDVEFFGEDTIVYVDNYVVYTYNIKDKKTQKQQDIESINSDALFVDESRKLVYVFDEEDAWELNIQEALATRVANKFKFRAINSAAKNTSDELVFSVDTRSNDSGIYRFSSNSSLVNIESKLKQSLPKETYFYSARYTVTGESPIITVTILGDIPSSNSTKAVARAEAEKFITSLGLDGSVQVVYR